MNIELDKKEVIELMSCIIDRRMKIESTLNSSTTYGWHFNLLEDTLKSLVSIQNKVSKELAN